jgi:ribosomal protein S18 acetylase RimI-like enzyme
MDKITIRKGRPEDAEDFFRLINFTAPEYFQEIFGSDAGRVLEGLFGHTGNIFSFEHSYFMEIGGEVAGMTLFYDDEEKNKGIVRFVLFLIGYMRFKFFTHLPSLLKFGSIFARTRTGDLYSSNTAIYPKFRRRGLGEKLFGLSEKEARSRGLKRVVVDVKAGNYDAIKLRKKLGYEVEAALPILNIKGKTFEYLRLVKYLS